MAIDIGDAVPLAVFITDDTGAAANAGNVVLTITLPDLTVVTPAIVNGAVGAYSASYLTTQVGHHLVRWVATGANACSFDDDFNVVSADTRMLISLDDARRVLRLSASNTTGDEDLRTYISALTPVVEFLCGPVLTATKVWTVDGGGAAVLLPSAVTSVQSVTDTGVTLTPVSDYTVNLRSGIVTRGTLLYPFRFLPGIQNVSVTYTVGGPVVPANVVIASRIILKQMWQADQVWGRPVVPQDGDVMTPSGFLVPRRAVELLLPTPNVPGFA